MKHYHANCCWHKWIGFQLTRNLSSNRKKKKKTKRNFCLTLTEGKATLKCIKIETFRVSQLKKTTKGFSLSIFFSYSIAISVYDKRTNFIVMVRNGEPRYWVSYTIYFSTQVKSMPTRWRKKKLISNWFLSTLWHLIDAECAHATLIVIIIVIEWKRCFNSIIRFHIQCELYLFLIATD